MSTGTTNGNRSASTAGKSGKRFNESSRAVCTDNTIDTTKGQARSIVNPIRPARGNRSQPRISISTGSKSNTWLYGVNNGRTSPVAMRTSASS